MTGIDHREAWVLWRGGTSWHINIAGVMCSAAWEGSTRVRCSCVTRIYCKKTCHGCGADVFCIMQFSSAQLLYLYLEVKSCQQNKE